MLREYQREAIVRMRKLVAAGKTRILLVKPTGSGKTITASELVRLSHGFGNRILFVAHRLELIDQTVRTLERVGLSDIGVIRAADPRTNAAARIQVASVQTLARRTVPDFDLVIIDEAHRAMADTYGRSIFERQKSATIIGLTATPVRTDNKPLGSLFEELVIGAKYSELIAQGHIVSPVVYSTPTKADLSAVRTTAGDYNLADLEQAVNQGSLIGDLYTQWAKHPRQRTVCFAVSVAHSLSIVERFRAQGVRAEHLDGTTPEDLRRAILARLASGETELVSNVGVLCEGWDLPACKTMILARPTKSLGLYMQMAGRILRPWEDVRPIVLDHGGNVDRFGFPHEDREWSLTEKSKDKEPGAPATKVCKQCFAYVLASARVCEFCGYEFVALAPPTQRDEVDVDLECRTDVREPSEEDRIAFVVDQQDKARRYGLKPGWVWHEYKKKFGAEMPKRWWTVLGQEFKEDPAWQASVAERAARKAG